MVDFKKSFKTRKADDFGFGRFAETKKLSDNISRVAGLNRGFKIVNENLNLAEGPFPTMQAAQARLRELNAASPSFARFRKIVRVE